MEKVLKPRGQILNLWLSSSLLIACSAVYYACKTGKEKILGT